MSVEAVSGWEYSTHSKEITCPVFLKFPEDSFEDDTHVGTFYVTFENDKVVEIGCYCEGNSIGKPQ